MGYSEEWLCSIFSNLTDELSSALRNAVFSINIMQQYNLSRAEWSDYNCLRSASLSYFGAENAWEEEPWRYESCGIDADELSLYTKATQAVYRISVDPYTRRQTEYYANPRLCDMMGMAVEELLGNVAARRLPQHVSHLDFVFCLVAELKSSLEVESVSYVRWAWPGERGAESEGER